MRGASPQSAAPRCSAAGVVTQYRYDAFDRRVSVENGLGQRVRTQYDQRDYSKPTRENL